jgi:hypothetical protein
MAIPPNLAKAYKDGSFAIFVGAGLSRPSGLPTWEGLLNELITYSKDNLNLPDQKELELRALSKQPGKYLTVAEELKDIMSTDLQKYIKRRFNDSSLTPSVTLQKVIRLKAKFIITTNYDTLLENAFILVNNRLPNQLSYKDAATINDNILSNEPFILKAHGDARSAPNEIIITEMDYRNIIYKEKGYQSVLHVLFSTCNVLFLGASLEDPELKLLLGYIHNIFHGGSPKHFALMDEEGLTSVEIDRWRKDFNIQISTYNPKDNHAAVEHFVDELLAI